MSRQVAEQRWSHARWLALVCAGVAGACGSDTGTSGAAVAPSVMGPAPSGAAAPTTPAKDDAPNGDPAPLPPAGTDSSETVTPPTLLPMMPEGASADAGEEADAGGGKSCPIIANAGSLSDGDANVDLAQELQRIAGFGGMDGGFYPELTSAQIDTAFGTGTGQIGLSIIRIRIPEVESQFGNSMVAAARAVQLGATVMATPWTPPVALKSNNDVVAGSLNVASYGAYADYLLRFRDFMQSKGVPIYAISVQNEPDIKVTYASCDWTAQQLLDWVKAQGSKFGDTKLIAAESFHFDHALTDPLLQDPAAAAQVDIIAGHIYGSGLADYPLARQLGKEVWMTEHYTDSASSANDWPLALGVATDINNVMAANFSAYVWWAIRRSYGLITEDGLVSKRGYVMSQYARFIRPGFVRVRATQPSNQNVAVTAYKNDAEAVIVAVNRSAQPQAITLDVFNSCATSLSRFTTSASKNAASDAAVALSAGRAEVTLDAQSVTTFVSQ